MKACGRRFRKGTYGCSRPSMHAGCCNGDGEHVHAKEYGKEVNPS